MPRLILPSEKETLQTPGQWSKLYLAIHTPRVVYSAILASVPASTDMIYQVAFSGGVGTLTDVMPDMTLYVGSTVGAYDLGMCRIRKTPVEGTFYINETSQIKWQTGCHLTVVEDYQIWQKPIRIVNNAPYMDVEIPYSSQHASFDPVPILGSHIVAKRTGDIVTVTAGPTDATASWVIGSTIASVLWTAPTASAINDPTAVNPQITFDADGWHAVYCTVVAVNSKSFTGVRWVYIYSDENPPVASFTLKGCEGSHDSGGWSFGVEMYAHAAVRDRALCILFSEDFADNQPIIQPSPHVNRENILAVGWIAGESIELDNQKGTVEFKVENAAYWLKKIPDFPVGLEFKTGSAAAWTDMPMLTVDRALWHLFHWRSTVTRVMDVFLTGDTRYSSAFASSAANLWERINEIAQTSIFAAPGVDRLNRLHCQIEAQMTPQSERESYAVDSISARDWHGQIHWSRNTVQKIALLHFSGIAVGSDKSATAYFSLSPGHVHAHYGETESVERILVSGQENANALCGLYFGWNNNPTGSFEVNLAGANRFLDCFPRQYVNADIAPEDDPRSAGFSGRCIPRSMSISHNPATGAISTTVTLEPESFPGLAVNGDVVKSDGESLDVDLSIPSTPNFPSMPALPYIASPTEEPDNQPKIVVIYSDNFGMLYTKNFDESDQTKIEWKFMNNGIASPEIDQTTAKKLVVTPSGGMYLYKAFYDDTPYEYLHYAPAIGGVWRWIAGPSDFPYGIHSIAVNPTASDSVIVCGKGALDSPGNIKIASYGVLTSAPDSLPMRGPRGDAVWSNGKWIVFGSHIGFFTTPWVAVYSASGNALYNGSINSAVGQDYARRFAHAIGTSDKIIEWDSSGAGGYNVITNAGTVVSRSTEITPAQNYQSVAFSPTGNVGIAASSYLVAHKTTDGGATWTPLTSIPMGCDVWENCGDDYRWIFKHGNYPALTMNQGATYVDKIGNLLEIAPLLNITGIRYVA